MLHELFERGCNMATLSERIKELRKNAKLTQAEFGTLFGVAKSTVCLYETGRNTPNDDIKIAIANYFNVSMDYLLGNTDRPGFDSKTPTVMQTKITGETLDTFHAYLDLSAENKKRVEDYVKILTELERCTTKI